MDTAAFVAWLGQGWGLTLIAGQTAFHGIEVLGISSEVVSDDAPADPWALLVLLSAFIAYIFRFHAPRATGRCISSSGAAA